jgi:Ca-activated chloride channel family protein
MRRAAILALVTLSVVVVVDAQSPGRSQQPTFRSSVELIVVHVNVVDPARRPITGLTRDDFVVLENGTPQPLSHFLTADGPMDVALLVDVSSSMAPLLPMLRESTLSFLERLDAHDRAMVVGVGRRIHMLANLTDDRDELRRSVQQLSTRGTTSLYDGLYITLKTLSARSADFARRQAIVVFSDGYDTSSIIGVEEVARQSMRCGIPIYTILLKRDPALADARGLRFEYASQLFDLKSLSRDTGGRAFEIERADHLKATYESIARDLAQQYVLAFVSSRGPATRGTPQVVVRIPSQPSSIARTHVGYLVRSYQ